MEATTTVEPLYHVVTSTLADAELSHGAVHRSLLRSEPSGTRCAWSNSNLLATSAPLTSLRTVTVIDANSPGDAHVSLDATSKDMLTSAQHLAWHSSGEYLATVSAARGRIAVWKMQATMHDWTLMYEHVLGEGVVRMEWMPNEDRVHVPFAADSDTMPDPWRIPARGPSIVAGGMVLLCVTTSGRFFALVNDGFQFQPCVALAVAPPGQIISSAAFLPQVDGTLLAVLHHQREVGRVLDMSGEGDQAGDLVCFLVSLAAIESARDVTQQIILMVSTHSRVPWPGQRVAALAAMHSESENRVAVICENSETATLTVETFVLEAAAVDTRRRNVWRLEHSLSHANVAGDVVCAERVSETALLAITLSDATIIFSPTSGAPGVAPAAVRVAGKSRDVPVVGSSISPNGFAAAVVFLDGSGAVFLLPAGALEQPLTSHGGIAGAFLGALLNERDYWDVVMALQRSDVEWGVAERAIGLLEQHASATSAGGPFALTARLVHGVRMVVARAFPSRLSDMTDAYAQLQLARILDIFRACIPSANFESEEMLMRVDDFKKVERVLADETSTLTYAEAMALTPLAAWVLNFAYVGLISFFYQFQLYSFYSRNPSENEQFPMLPAAESIGRGASRLSLIRTILYISRLRSLSLSSPSSPSSAPKEPLHGLFDAAVPARLTCAQLYNTLWAVEKAGTIAEHELFGHRVYVPQLSPDVQLGRMPALGTITDDLEFAPAIVDGGLYYAQAKDAPVFRVNPLLPTWPVSPTRLCVDVVRMSYLSPSQPLKQCARCFRFSDAEQGGQGNIATWTALWRRACVCGGKWRRSQPSKGNSALH